MVSYFIYFAMSLLPRRRGFARKREEEFNHLELAEICLLGLTLKSSFGGFKVLNRIVLSCNICIFLASSMKEVGEKEHFCIFRNDILNIPVVSESALFTDVREAEVVPHR